MKDLTKDPIVQSVIRKMNQRSKDGIEKYGTTLLENDKDCFLTHLQEELMDAVNYIEKLSKSKFFKKKGKKSKSERLRSVLHLVHESNNIELDFEDYYNGKMEQIIDHFKKKINQ